MLPRIIRRVLPRLYYDNRGLFLLLVGLMWRHLFGAIDQFLPNSDKRHSFPVFTIQSTLLPTEAWGSIHVILFAMLLWGVAKPKNNNLFLARVACACSATLSIIYGAGFFFAAVTDAPLARLMITGYAGLAVAASLAALQEPVVNPANPVEEEQDSAAR